MGKKFALIGAGGYIAKKHFQAIKDVDGELVASCDHNDSVGILDSYFPECEFFTEVERFERYLEKQKREGNPIDYLVICTPNYLHDSHIRMGLRCGCNVICEKPLVINPRNLDVIMDMEEETGKKVYPILQLRLYPKILDIKNKIKDGGHKVSITYYTPRGKWYEVSWKGKQEYSGGLVTNIGIHLFDMLLWIFGKCDSFTIGDYYDNLVSGNLKLDKADVNFELSVDNKNKPTRDIIVDGIKIDFNDGFKDLHSKIYKKILDDNWFGTIDTIESIDLVTRIRNYDY